jgi:hypothetical protein
MVCVICLDELCNKEVEVVLVCCRNKLHRDCFLQYMCCPTSKQLCPICRSPFGLLDGILSKGEFVDYLSTIEKLQNNQVDHINKVLDENFKKTAIGATYVSLEITEPHHPSQQSESRNPRDLLFRMVRNPFVHLCTLTLWVILLLMASVSSGIRSGN